MLDRRARTIIELLEQLHELTDPVRAGNGDGQAGLLLMPHAKECRMFAKDGRSFCTCHLRAVTELERLLRVMRDDHHASLLVLPDGEKVSLRACWWNINERYLRCVSTTRDVWWQQARWRGLSQHQAIVAQPGGWKLALATERSKRNKASLAVRVRVVTWDAKVRPAVVERGVQWVAESWALEVEPFLPREQVAA